METPLDSKSVLRVLEFYSGIGGMHYSLRAAEVPAVVVDAFDINEVANDVYQLNFGFRPNQGNVQRLTVSQLDKWEADMWLMSPPCQPYTRQGLKKDANDGRATSFLCMLEKLPKMSTPPSYIFVENVVGFETSVTHSHLVNVLEGAGFTFQEFILTPLQFQIPYSRPRYFCLAKRFPLEFANPEMNGRLSDWPPPLPLSAQPATAKGLVLQRQQLLSNEHGCPLFSDRQLRSAMRRCSEPNVMGDGRKYPAACCGDPIVPLSDLSSSVSPDLSSDLLSDLSPGLSSDLMPVAGHEEEGGQTACRSLADFLEISPGEENPDSRGDSASNGWLPIAARKAIKEDEDKDRLTTVESGMPGHAGSNFHVSSVSKDDTENGDQDGEEMAVQPPSREQTIDDDVNSVKDCSMVTVLANLTAAEESVQKLAFAVPANVLLRWGEALDIVTPKSTRCCCFTKSYIRYAKGTGSVLATKVPVGVSGCDYGKSIHRCEVHIKEEGTQGTEMTCWNGIPICCLGLRYFSPREVANLHSFPPDFQFPPHVDLKQRYALLGNSLSVAVVERLLRYLLLS